MTPNLSKTIGALFNLALSSNARKATKYLSKDLTVKVTRTRKKDKRSRMESFVVSFGAPNYAERKFIKSAILAKEPFPVKKSQVKFYPEKSK